MVDEALAGYRPAQADTSSHAVHGTRAEQPRGAQGLRGRLAKYTSRPLQTSFPLLVGLAVVASLYWGWLNRDTGAISPEDGWGYALGITGGSLMLLLPLYSLRKRLKFMRSLGNIRHWFRIHMLLGIIGPTLVIFHTNFGLGSANSTVALLAMLVVAVSGVIGRYLYAKIHMGLYGRKAEVRGLLDDATAFKTAFGADVEMAPSISEELKAYEQRVLAPPSGVLGGLNAVLGLGAETRRSRRRLIREFRQVAKRNAKRDGVNWFERRKRLRAARRHLEFYFRAVRKAAVYDFYDRLFALWHLLHVPLFVLLILSVTTHIVAVHLY